MSKRITRSVAKAVEQSEPDDSDDGDRLYDTPKDTTSTDQDDSNITHFTIPFQKEKTITCEQYGPPTSPPTLIFTHGAGGGITDSSTRDFALGFGTLAPIVTYQGSLNLSSRIKTFHTVIKNRCPTAAVALGGRSMGARAAVLTALEVCPPPQTLVLVSWPLVNGKGEQEFERRQKILLDLPASVEVLFIGGDQDEQCDLAMLREVIGLMSAKSWLVVVRKADHGMSLKGKSKEGTRAMRLKTGEVAATWLQSRHDGLRYCELEWNREEGKVADSGWRAEG